MRRICRTICWIIATLIGPVTVAQAQKRCGFVVDNTASLGNDSLLKNFIANGTVNGHIVGLAHTVVLLDDDNAATWDTTTFDYLFVTSSSVSSANMSTMKNYYKPMITYDADVDQWGISRLPAVGASSSNGTFALKKSSVLHYVTALDPDSIRIAGPRYFDVQFGIDTDSMGIKPLAYRWNSGGGETGTFPTQDSAVIFCADSGVTVHTGLITRGKRAFWGLGVNNTQNTDGLALAPGGGYRTLARLCLWAANDTTNNFTKRLFIHDGYTFWDWWNECGGCLGGTPESTIGSTASNTISIREDKIQFSDGKPNRPAHTYGFQNTTGADRCNQCFAVGRPEVFLYNVSIVSDSGLWVLPIRNHNTASCKDSTNDPGTGGNSNDNNIGCYNFRYGPHAITTSVNWLQQPQSGVGVTTYSGNTDNIDYPNRFFFKRTENPSNINWVGALTAAFDTIAVVAGVDTGGSFDTVFIPDTVMRKHMDGTYKGILLGVDSSLPANTSCCTEYRPVKWGWTMRNGGRFKTATSIGATTVALKNLFGGGVLASRKIILKRNITSQPAESVIVTSVVNYGSDSQVVTVPALTYAHSVDDSVYMENASVSEKNQMHFISYFHSGGAVTSPTITISVPNGGETHSVGAAYNFNASVTADSVLIADSLYLSSDATYSAGDVLIAAASGYTKSAATWNADRGTNDVSYQYQSGDVGTKYAIWRVWMRNGTGSLSATDASNASYTVTVSGTTIEQRARFWFK